MKNQIVMGSFKAVYQFLAFLALSAIIQSEECQAVSVNLSSPDTFVDSLFDKFGSNNLMNSQQFDSLLKELNIGSFSHANEHDHGHDHGHGSENDEHGSEHDEHASDNDKSKVSSILFSSLSFSIVFLFNIVSLLMIMVIKPVSYEFS